MLDLLTKAYAKITQTKRYRPKIQWSGGNLFTHDAFRVFEFLFGRKYGIRREAKTEVWEDESGVHIVRNFYTPEAFLAHQEAVLRSYFSLDFWKKVFEPDVVFGLPKPVYATLAFLGISLNFELNSSLFLPVVAGAIALDAFVDVTTTTGTSLTYSHTTSGSDRVIVVLPIVAGASTSSVTYNADSATHIDSLVMTDESSRQYSLWRRVAPATGANNVVINVSSSVFIRGTSASYTGVDQTNPTNGTAAKVENESSASSPIGVSITSTVADCWGLGGFRSDAGTQGNGTMALRAVANSLGYLDTNGSLGSSGSETLDFTISSGNGWLIAALIAPASAAGPTNLKSLDTNVAANIKSYNTNVIANIKSINTNA